MGLSLLVIYVIIESVYNEGHFKLKMLYKYDWENPAPFLMALFWPLALTIYIIAAPFLWGGRLLLPWFEKNKDKEFFMTKSYKTKKILYGEKD